jgi:TRAP-type uncharacterized transport system fused permease subunit
MVYNPALIMQGTWQAILLSASTAALGVAAIAVALEGFWLARLRWWERAALAVFGLALIDLRWEIVAIGSVCGLAVLLSQIHARRRPVAASLNRQGG